jgi:hypothetical protein
MAAAVTPTLFGIFSDLSVFLASGFRSFPVAFAGTALFVGLFTGNYAMLFFLIGLLLWTPLHNFALNGIAGFFGWGTPRGPICNIVVKDSQLGSGDSDPVFVSNWMAMSVFIFSYIFTNAYFLYKIPTEYPPNGTPDDIAATDEKAGLRKSRAVLAMIMVLIIAIVFISLRVFVSRCDGMVGTAVAAVLYSLLGYGWYWALHGIGQDRLSDLFGVANRLLSPSALVNQPYMCLPQTVTTPSA